MYAHVIFSGPARRMQLWYKQDENSTAELRHTFEAHDVGVNDGTLPDEYGHKCKCPPGTFLVGKPQHLNPPERPYGYFFTPLSDETSDGPMEEHGRDGIGVHGGGSDLPDPFADRQGWEWTFGCLRLQNEDNKTFVSFVEYVQSFGGKVEITVDWT